MSIIARLGDLVEFYAGFGFPNQYQGSVEGEIPFAKVSDISRSLEDGGNAIYRAANYVSGEVAHKLRAKPFPTGTIVFAKIGEAIRKNRRALTTREMLFDNNVMGVRPMNERIDIDYLFRYLDTVDFYKLANTTAVPSLRKSVLGELQIPLPPLDEQKRIAAILDKANQLRQQRRQAIALLDSLTQSIFLEMFGDLAKKARLEEICARITDGTHQAPKWSVDGVPFLFVSNVRNQSISFETNKYVSREEYARLTKNCPIEAGDVLYTAVGSYGNAAVVPAGKTFVFQRHIAHIKPHAVRVNPVYLAFALESLAVKQQADRVARGVAQKTVTLASLREFEIPLPKIEDQKLFERKILKVRQLAMRDQSGRLDHLFSSLQHRAFTGML
ncbi:restriction endonuclease subunit S [Rhizobium leguminosarum]|uniref:Restriction endonuclease subunit S n=1 Tax=Rhizobium leguminosarum TaxID=384 RepID=A0ABD7PMW2_RHILE|nr:restriction endonuclease subunit S [Rhizobium leguminosarum]TAU73042.1 restriction endonuclease subunit S [Rhizobium leguminosarum]TAV40681.1 restriction endonuclease subunit S [Rhizobium leguminosarum]TAW26654.1 restriction endonuclease subunit S [Rhizobium leguminosarum]TAW28661.1 restriction endonuclease subunit S [Rhizobium leguminosarum]